MQSKRASFLSSYKSDLPASVVVLLVALPLCLGIALASGAPLISGVIAGVVGGIVVGALSGSSLGVSGPAAGLAVIVLTAIEDLGAFDIFLVAVILAGLIQLIFGFVRAGIIAYYFPTSVITGMLAGIGIVIFLKQIPHAIGFDRDPEGDFAFHQIDGETTLSELAKAFEFFSLGPTIIAAVSLTILILWDSKWFKSRKGLNALPAPLVAVVSGVGLGLLFRSTSDLALTADQLVKIPVASGFFELKSFLTFPDFSALKSGIVYKTAIVIAVVASLETLLCVEATDKLDPLKRITPTNRELKAQGVGNIVSGFLGGLPVTQVIVRSSANIEAGGQSKLSSILHGVLLIAAIVFFPKIMNLIPLSTLAAVLLVVGYKLAKPTLFKRMWENGTPQFIPFVVTIIGIVFIDLLVGIGIGLAVAVTGLLIENYRIPFEFDDSKQASGKVRMVLAQQVSFLNKASVIQTLSSISNGCSIEIDASQSVYVHSDVVQIIDDFVVGAKAREITVVVHGLEHHQKGKPGAGAEVSSVPVGK